VGCELEKVDDRVKAEFTPRITNSAVALPSTPPTPPPHHQRRVCRLQAHSKHSSDIVWQNSRVTNPHVAHQRKKNCHHQLKRRLHFRLPLHRFQAFKHTSTTTMTTPSPQTWTLRLKSRKTTVLLHVDPLHTFSTIKSHLYEALKETGLKDPETNEPIPLPESPSDIQFGRPLDILDAQQGFQIGEWELPVYESEDDGGKGKGKGKAKAGNNSGGATAGVANVKDCPKGAGLKDGAVLAFRWAGDGTWDGDEDMEQELPDGSNMWGVKLASFEDAYGVNNETDVGGHNEYEG
jgi:hypothetical protein